MHSPKLLRQVVFCDAAERVKSLAGDLSTQSQALSTEMTRFLATIRAA